MNFLKLLKTQLVEHKNMSNSKKERHCHGVFFWNQQVSLFLSHAHISQSQSESGKANAEQDRK